MNRIKELLDDYKGELHTIEDSSYTQYTLSSKNTLPLNNPNIAKKTRDTGCYLRITYLKGNKSYMVDVYEETYEILGGSGTKHNTVETALDEVKKMLDRYCYKEKEQQQTRLF